MPKIEKVYEDSNAEVNPHFNPFMQLGDNQSSAKQTEASQNQQTANVQGQNSQITQSNNQIEKPVQSVNPQFFNPGSQTPLQKFDAPSQPNQSS